MNTERLKLKPYPFRGGKADKVIGLMGINLFKCRNRECGATVSFNNYYYNAHVDEAVKAWNTRTGASR